MSFIIPTFVYNQKHNNMKNIDLAPKSVFYTKNADGTTTRTEEWDFSTIAGFEIAKTFVILIASLIIGSVVSPILLLISVIAFTGRGKILHIIGILVSCYFFWDVANGWLCTVTLSFFLDESGINTMIAINAGAALAHLVLLIGLDYIHSFATVTKDETSQYLRFFGLLIVVILIGGFISKGITAKHVGWLEQNIKYVPVQTDTTSEKRTPEQIKED